MKIRPITLTLITLISIIGFSFLLNQQVTAQQIPELAWKCLPPPLYGKNLNIRNSELLEGITEYEDSTYLIIRMQYEDVPFFVDQKGSEIYVGRFAIALYRNECFNINDPRMAVDYLFQSRIIPGMPEPVAKEIALQFWTKQLELGGGDKEELKAALLEPPSAEGGVAVIYAEDQWALKQLGIDVPISIPGIAPISSEARFQDKYGEEQNLSNPSTDSFELEMKLFKQLENKSD